MKPIYSIAMISLFCTAGLTNLSAGVYQEANGYVVMEMENTETDHSECWTVETGKNPEGGKALRQAKCNDMNTGPAKNPLKYTFKINTGGVYTLYTKIWKDHGSNPPDKSNDVYVRVAGDFTGVEGGASTAALKADTKHYGGASNEYVWTSGMLDYDHKKWQNKYDFKSGEQYDLFISARAKNAVVDRILFATDEGKTKGQANGTAESSTGTTSMFTPNQSHLSTPNVVAHRGSQSIRFEVKDFDALHEKDVVLVIHDLRGNAIKQISTRTNFISWDKTDFGGNQVPNGIYISELRMNNTSVRQSFLSF